MQVRATPKKKSAPTRKKCLQNLKKWPWARSFHGTAVLSNFNSRPWTALSKATKILKTNGTYKKWFKGWSMVWSWNWSRNSRARGSPQKTKCVSIAPKYQPNSGKRLWDKSCSSTPPAFSWVKARLNRRWKRKNSNKQTSLLNSTPRTPWSPTY